MPTTAGDMVHRLNRVFRDVFDNETIEVRPDMTARDIDEWDSVMHINLIVAVEKEFRLKLNWAEFAELENVGAMMRVLERKLAG